MASLFAPIDAAQLLRTAELTRRLAAAGKDIELSERMLKFAEDCELEAAAAGHQARQQ